MSRIDWPAILERGALIVRSYDTGVTLRQLFYRLVAADLLENTTNAYKALSSHTANARRLGEFPALIDRTREIERSITFGGPEDARKWLRDIYRRDRTEGQDVSVYLGVEKRGIVEQLSSWFGHMGLPVLALGGYSSQSFVDEVAADVSYSGRPSVLLYAGDFDPSGEDIDRDFCARVGCFDTVVRVALNAEQVASYGLPPQPGKAADSRSRGFVARHGALVQVELDALPPDVLRGLYDEELALWWSPDAFSAVLDRERAERAMLAGAAR